LCDIDKVDLVRKKIRLKDILSVRLSEYGKEPASHTFCFLTGDQKRVDQLLEKQELTIMELSEPKEFLEKWNLKIIKK
jgi:hypothetical protein